MSREIEFEITTDSGNLYLDLEGFDANANYHYTLEGPISISGAKNLPVDDRLFEALYDDELPAGKYKLNIIGNFTDIDAAVILEHITKTPAEGFTGFDAPTGNILADNTGKITKLDDYKVKVGDATVDFSETDSHSLNLDKGVLTINKDGSYTYQIYGHNYEYVPSADIATTLKIQVLDAKDNVLKTHTLNISGDTTPPAAGTLTLKNFVDTGVSDSDKITNNTYFTPVVQDAEKHARTIIEYSANNGEYWGEQREENGYLNPLQYAGDGTYQIRGKVIDAAGNVSYTNVETVTIDTTAPTLSEQAVSTDGIITGKTEAGATVVAKIGDEVIGTTTADKDGNFSIATGKTNGESIQLTITDIAGNKLTNSYSEYDDYGYYIGQQEDDFVTITVPDTTPPAAGTLVLENFVDTGVSDSDKITDNIYFTPVVQGAEAHATTEIEYSADGENWGADGVSGDGTYQIRGKVTDVAGNVSYTNVETVTIDTTAPTLSEQAVSTDGIITGKTEAGATVIATHNGEKVGEAVADENGNFSIATGKTTNNGERFELAITDIAGNKLTERHGGYGEYDEYGQYIWYEGYENDYITVIAPDTTPPAAGTLALEGFTDTGVSDSDKITKYTFTPVVKDAEAGAYTSIEYSTDGGETWKQWTLTPSQVNDHWHPEEELTWYDTPLVSYNYSSFLSMGIIGRTNDGTYQIRGKVTDTAGNVSYTNIETVTLDTTAPTISEQAISTDGVITGITEAGATVVAMYNGEKVGEAIADENGNFSIATGKTVNNGERFELAITDIAGNKLEVATLVLQDFTDTGVSDSDKITNDNSFTPAVQDAEAYIMTEIEYSTDGGNTWQSSNNSYWSDGTYQIRGKVADYNDDVSYTNVETVTVDTTPPEFTYTELLDDNQTITGITEAFATVTADNGTSATANENGSFSIDLGAPYTSGEMIGFSAMDLAGNYSHDYVYAPIM
ncbi:hypothetical protein B0181_09955 [Moraxella caviae]|uniref:Protein of uncharacterized function (DUF3607) n=1 Tax=Moraxella caviae TaxID=34060 RepID=A0A1S9ZW50_9GAMM|nr:Ig-like domain-containing protein [Moraxella caviae]OOR87637.1 hypothetical protein B0181_09955 [Moraxella caviae]STZ10093.1 Protein of uncharacterised function (DUF3607) [Moraxella caviae]